MWLASDRDQRWHWHDQVLRRRDAEEVTSAFSRQLSTIGKNRQSQGGDVHPAALLRSFVPPQPPRPIKIETKIFFRQGCPCSQRSNTMTSTSVTLRKRSSLVRNT